MLKLFIWKLEVPLIEMCHTSINVGAYVYKDSYCL